MILVVEPIRVSLEHAAFNAGLLRALGHAFPDEPVTFVAPTGHARPVENEIGDWPANFQHRELKTPPRHASFRQRLGGDFRTLALVSRLAAEPTTRAVIFCSVTSSLLYALAYQKLLGRLPVETFAILHGGLAEFARRRARNPLRWVSTLRVSMPLAQATGVRWILLEKAIHRQLQSIAPRLASRASVFPHPIPATDGNSGSSHHDKLTVPAQVGFLGLATPQKGLWNFLELAARFQKEAPSLAKFHMIGRSHANFQSAAQSFSSCLATQPAREPLPRAEYLASLKDLDFACFLFEGKHYDLTASGALLDAIALGIPLLNRPHPLIESIVSSHGEIGLVAEAGQEFEVLRKFLLTPDEERYASWRANLAAARASRTPEALAGVLRRTLPHASTTP